MFEQLRRPQIHNQWVKLDFLSCMSHQHLRPHTLTSVAPCVVLPQGWFLSEHSLKLPLLKLMLNNECSYFSGSFYAKTWWNVHVKLDLSPYCFFLCVLITDHLLKHFQPTSVDLSGHWVVGMVPASCHCLSGIASCLFSAATSSPWVGTLLGEARWVGWCCG